MWADTNWKWSLQEPKDQLLFWNPALGQRATFGKKFSMERLNSLWWYLTTALAWESRNWPPPRGPHLTLPPRTRSNCGISGKLFTASAIQTKNAKGQKRKSPELRGRRSANAAKTKSERLVGLAAESSQNAKLP